MKVQGIGGGVRKGAEVFGSIVAAVLLAWTSLTYVKLRTTRNGMLWWLPKLSAGAFSLETALVGAAGAVVGAVGGSLSVVVGYALVALAAGAHVGRTWRTPKVFTGAFGASEPAVERRRYLLRRRWGVRLGPVPEARVRRDIPFWIPPGLGRPLLCDVWQPAAGVPASGLGLVYLHGSAWTLLDKDCGTRPFFRHLAAQGHVVMDAAYRLYPETDIPGMVGDAKRAVAWLKANAAAYGVDPDCLVLGGASAGGHVALLAAYTAGHPELTPADVGEADTSVRGVLGWYSPVDLAACYEHYEIATLAQMMPVRPDWNTPPSPLLRRLLGADAERLGFQKVPAGRLDWIVGGSPQQVPERYALLSPITHVRAGCPPTLLMQGRDDIIVPPGPSVEMRERLRRVGVPAALLLLPRAEHGFDLLATSWSPAARQALWHAERFLALVATRPHSPHSGCRDAVRASNATELRRLRSPVTEGAR
jgi:acetyl esterase/lipase